jgi:hypothetical protein
MNTDFPNFPKKSKFAWALYHLLQSTPYVITLGVFIFKIPPREPNIITAYATSLSLIGRHFEIIGGVITLVVITIITKIIWTFICNRIALNIIKKLIKKGETKDQIMNRVRRYYLSIDLFFRIKNYLDKNLKETPNDMDLNNNYIH